MKKLWFALIIFLQVSQLSSQSSNFECYFSLRMEGDLIYCDLKPKNDYTLLAFQFGIINNADQTEFVSISSPLPEYSYRNFNELCKNVILNLWIDKSLRGFQFKQDEPFITFIFREKIPTDHFICILPSSGPLKCDNMPREAIDLQNNILNITDLCIDYKINDGKILILNTLEHKAPMALITYLSEDYKSIFIQSNEAISSQKMEFRLFDLTSNLILSHHLILNKSYQIELPSTMTSGVYIYNIVSNSGYDQFGKLFIK